MATNVFMFNFEIREFQCIFGLKTKLSDAVSLYVYSSCPGDMGVRTAIRLLSFNLLITNIRIDSHFESTTDYDVYTELCANVYMSYARPAMEGDYVMQQGASHVAD